MFFLEAPHALLGTFVAVANYNDNGDNHYYNASTAIVVDGDAVAATTAITLNKQ